MKVPDFRVAMQTMYARVSTSIAGRFCINFGNRSQNARAVAKPVVTISKKIDFERRYRSVVRSLLMECHEL